MSYPIEEGTSMDHAHHFVACPHTLAGSQSIVVAERDGWTYDHRTARCDVHKADHAEHWVRPRSEGR